MPPDSTNSLWFSAMCSNKRDPSFADYIDYPNDPTCIYQYECGGALGDAGGSVSTRGLIRKFPSSGTWTIPFQGSGYEETVINEQTGYSYNVSFADLKVGYCLAESTDYKCKIGVSNAMLLVVVLCTLTKVVL